MKPFAPDAAKLTSSGKSEQWPRGIEVAWVSKSEKFDGLGFRVCGLNVAIIGWGGVDSMVKLHSYESAEAVDTSNRIV